MELHTSLSTPETTIIDGRESMTVISSWRPRSFLRSLFSRRTRPTFSAYLHGIKNCFTFLINRIRYLEALKLALCEQISLVRAMNDELIERERQAVLAHQRLEEMYPNLSAQVRQQEEFMQMVTVIIGPEGSSRRAALTAMSDEETQQALVDNILEAAKDKNSPWARVVAALAATTIPEVDESMIAAAIREKDILEREIRKSEHICAFWKASAMANGSNGGLLSFTDPTDGGDDTSPVFEGVPAQYIR